MAVRDWMLWRWRWLMEVGPTLREVRRARRRAPPSDAALLAAIWRELRRTRRAVAETVTLSRETAALAVQLRIPQARAQGVALRLRGASWSQVREAAGECRCRQVAWALGTLWVLASGGLGGRAGMAAEQRPRYGQPAGLPRRPRTVHAGRRRADCTPPTCGEGGARASGVRPA